jgi:hypothetical protein
LERFNRKFNAAFTARKPQLDIFITTIKRICQDYYDDYLLIQKGELARVERITPEFATLPDDYEAYVLAYVG